MTKARDLGDIAQSVAVNLPTALGSAGETLVVNSAADGLEFGAASGGGSMTVYNDLNGTDGTPSGYTYLTNASSPSNGDLAFVTSNNTVYVRASSGWRKIATVQEAPGTVTGHSASYPSIGQNATTDITLSCTDPEGFDINWSYAVGGNGTLAGSNINNSGGDTLASIAVQTANSNSGGTNTITYRITRETTTIAGDFTVTFTATDSQSTGTSDTGAINFTIAFVVWTSSATRTTVTDSSSSYTGYGQGPVASNHDATHLIIPACRYNNDTGALVYYTRSGTTFTEQGKLSVSLSGTYKNIGRTCAGNRDLTKLLAGSLNGYSYLTRSGSTWTERTAYTTNNKPGPCAFSDGSNYVLYNVTNNRYIIGTAGATSLGNWSASVAVSGYNSNGGPCAISGNGNYVMLAFDDDRYAIYYNGSSTDDGSWGTANSPSSAMGSNTQQFITSSNILTNTADSYGVALNRDGSLAAYTDHNYGVNIVKRTGTSWSITQRFIPDSSLRWNSISMSEDGDVILLTSGNQGFQVWEGSASTGTGYTHSATYDDSSFTQYPSKLISNTSSGLSRDGEFFFAGVYPNYNYGYAYTP